MIGIKFVVLEFYFMLQMVLLCNIRITVVYAPALQKKVEIVVEILN